jgi:hypothetical protein
MAVLAVAVALLVPGHTVDLATGYVDGHRVLGRSVSGVTAGLGRPDFREPNRVGWGKPERFTFEVLFHKARAWSIVFERGPLRDPNVGELLGRTSVAAAAAIRARYAYEVAKPYACKRAVCMLQLAGSLHLVLGTQPRTGTWLTVYSPTR